MQAKSILVVGGGIAGLSTALKLADAGHAVTLVTRLGFDATASYRAQGGIAAVLAADDSIASHGADTDKAGVGLCHSEAVAQVVRAGARCIHWLEDQGVRFSTASDGTSLDLGQEGGHTARRVVHAADATGRAVMSVLELQARSHQRIELMENRFVADLITSKQLGLDGSNRCIGVRVLDPGSGALENVGASAVILATGGASGLYLHTTNPDACSGDGIAMAWRAGCRVANMEFVQFHPTCLYHPDAPPVLISETLRGEGAVLRLPDGTAFMAHYDPRAELAPRDIVARAIHHEIASAGIDHVYLDITHQPAAMIRARFPNVYQSCLAVGLDITDTPIPVVPAAHYTCGGIVTDLSGQTDLPWLYAVGECGFTGLHGANRLASNSLLEALVFADQVTEGIDRDLGSRRREPVASADSQPSNQAPGESLPALALLVRRLRRVMWNQVGIVRSTLGLQQGARQLADLAQELDGFGTSGALDILDLRNQITVAQLITESARCRHESRGLHFNRDYPDVEGCGVDTLLVPDEFSDQPAPQLEKLPGNQLDARIQRGKPGSRPANTRSLKIPGPQAKPGAVKSGSLPL